MKNNDDFFILKFVACSNEIKHFFETINWIFFPLSLCKLFCKTIIKFLNQGYHHLIIIAAEKLNKEGLGQFHYCVIQTSYPELQMTMLQSSRKRINIMRVNCWKIPHLGNIGWRLIIGLVFFPLFDSELSN